MRSSYDFTDLALDRAALVQLSRNAFESAWLPEEKKAAFLAALPG